VVRTPVRLVPVHVERAVTRARWLRWLDALVTWLALWGIVALVWESAMPAAAVGALIGVSLAALVRPLRVRWRPVSALVSLSVSRRLRPGDHAWLVLSERVEPVIVTARRRLRLVVASPEQGVEGLEIRRTRVLVVPSAPAPSAP
jgi:hypothetical protein